MALDNVYKMWAGWEINDAINEAVKQAFGEGGGDKVNVLAHFGLVG